MRHVSAVILFACTSAAQAGCGLGTPVPVEAVGPLPLTSADAPIVRLITTDSTIERTLTTVYWKEGNGPVRVDERIKPLVDAFPKELQDDVSASESIPSTGTAPMRRSLNVAWGAVVSVHPDVMLVSIRPQTPRSAPATAYPFQAWSSPPNGARGDEIHRRLEDFSYLVKDSPVHISAGPLAPWSDRLWVVSTEPAVRSGRLEFQNDQAIVPLPNGSLLLSHHDDDVDVSRRDASPARREP